MFISMPAASFSAAATTAALVANTDYALADKGVGGIRVLPLTLKGLRFLAWETATNGQPGLGLTPDSLDLLLLLLNIQATAAGKGAAWVQT